MAECVADKKKLGGASCIPEGLSDWEFVPLTVEEGLWEEEPHTEEEMFSSLRLPDGELVERELGVPVDATDCVTDKIRVARLSKQKAEKSVDMI